MKNIIIFFLLFTGLVNTQAQTYIGDPADIDQILQNIKQFSGYVMTSDYEAIADAYTPDGKIFPDGSEIITGREGIKKYWILPEGVSTSWHNITPLEINVLGEYAHDHGTYEGKTKRKDGTEASWRGKYVIVWKKQDGTWKMYLDIWNRIRE